MQRPDQFAGRADLTDEEFKAKVERDTDTRKRALNAAGSFAGDGAWLDRTFRQTSLIVEPADGKLPPLTPEAQAKRALAPRGTYGNGPLDGPEDFTLYDRCISLGVVGSLTPKIYGNAHRIIQTQGYVAILNEMIHETRVIPLDGRAHISPRIHEYLGDARGHFDGSTLVVETTNFTDKTHMGYNNRYNSEKYRLVERFTPVSPTRLQWQATIEDPDTWTRPWTFTMPLTRDDTQPVFEYGCHEGNLGLEHILSAARAEERRR
jgi:hypothetical protein